MKKASFAILLLTLTIILRAPALSWQALEEDEACHFTAAAVMANGGTPYLDVVDGKTPLLWFLFGGVAKIFGPFNTTAHRLFTDLNVWLTALLLWWLGTLMGNPRAGRWGALLFTLFSICSTYKILSSNYELHFLAFDVFAYCCFALAVQKRRPVFLLGSGVAIATSFFVKQTAGINLATLGLVCCILFFSKPWRVFAIKALGNLIAGFVVALGCYALWIHSLGVFDPMIFWIWDYAWILTSKSMVALPFWERLFIRGGSWILGTALVQYWAMRSLFSFSRHQPFLGAIILWGLLELIPIVLGGRFPPHYFLMMLPPLCLLAGFWIAQTESIEIFFSQIRNPKRFAFVFFLMILPVSGAWLASSQVEWGNRLFGLKRADHAKLAVKIQEATRPNDRIFVWGHNPEFYAYSHRLPASRFLFVDFMTGRHGIPSKYVEDPKQYDDFAVPGMWELLFADFAKHPPALIIDTSPADLHDYKVFPISRYPQLDQYVKEHYRLGWVEDDVHFYVRQ